MYLNCRGAVTYLNLVKCTAYHLLFFFFFSVIANMSLDGASSKTKILQSFHIFSNVQALFLMSLWSIPDLDFESLGVTSL